VFKVLPGFQFLRREIQAQFDFFRKLLSSWNSREAAAEYGPQRKP
jgi:hypothetical protein